VFFVSGILLKKNEQAIFSAVTKKIPRESSVPPGKNCEKNLSAKTTMQTTPKNIFLGKIVAPNTTNKILSKKFFSVCCCPLIDHCRNAWKLLDKIMIWLRGKIFFPLSLSEYKYIVFVIKEKIYHILDVIRIRFYPPNPCQFYFFP
jgi:hypothetical protein